MIVTCAEVMLPGLPAEVLESREVVFWLRVCCELQDHEPGLGWELVLARHVCMLERRAFHQQHDLDEMQAGKEDLHDPWFLYVKCGHSQQSSSLGWHFMFPFRPTLYRESSERERRENPKQMKALYVIL